MRYTILKHQFVTNMPDRLDPGVLYISIEYATAAHLCCCGCGVEVVTPLTPTDWKMTFDGETISLWPSVGNWNDVARRANLGESERDKMWRLDVILCAWEVGFRFGSGSCGPKRRLRRGLGGPRAEPCVFRRWWFSRWRRGLGQGRCGCDPDGWWWHHTGRHRARRLGPGG